MRLRLVALLLNQTTEVFCLSELYCGAMDPLREFGRDEMASSLQCIVFGTPKEWTSLLFLSPKCRRGNKERRRGWRGEGGGGVRRWVSFIIASFPLVCLPPYKHVQSGTEKIKREPAKK